jgi:hypothetical protein
VVAMRHRALLSNCWPTSRRDESGIHSLRTALASRQQRVGPPHPTPPPRAVLTRAVELEIIPRLLLSGRAATKAQMAAWPAGPLCRQMVPDAQEVEEFARLILANDVSFVWPVVEDMRARGTTTETIYLDLLAPAARDLEISGPRICATSRRSPWPCCGCSR